MVLDIKKDSNIWFTSDLHFFHKNILNLGRSRFNSLDDMHDAIIDDWQSKVKPQDTVFILGDLAITQSTMSVAKLKDIVTSLSGTKFLVAGNHDSRLIRYELADVFHSIHDYLELLIDNKGAIQTVVLSHYPMFEWNKKARGSYHLHGHLHGLPSGLEGRIMDVGYDAVGGLISFDDVVKKMQNLPVIDRYRK